jgi:hypothetical protein
MENWVRSAKNSFVQPVIAEDFILYRPPLPPSIDGSRREAIIGSGIDVTSAQMLGTKLPEGGHDG